MMDDQSRIGLRYSLALCESRGSSVLTQKLKVLSLIIRTNFCWVLCWRLRSAVERDQLLGELDALVDTVEEEEVKFTLQQNRAEVRCDTMMCRCVHGCMRVCLNPCVCVCCVGCVQHVHDYRSEHAERTAALCAFACIFSRHCEVEPCICMIHNNLICLHVLRA